MSLPAREYDRSINSEVERLLHQNEVVVMDARGLAAGLTGEQFNWVPETGGWSAGQCLEHLNITHGKWLPLFEEAIRQGREKGMFSDGPFIYGFLSRMFLRILEPPVRRMKAPAPAGFHPEGELDPTRVVKEFEGCHARQKDALMAANGLNLEKIRVPSAFSKRLSYSLGMGFWINLAHDRRHIWQARQVCLSPGFPKK